MVSSVNTVRSAVNRMTAVGKASGLVIKTLENYGESSE